MGWERLKRGLPTDRGMLKREGDGVLHPLDGDGQRISGKPLTDDDLDPTDLICGAPVTLTEKLASKLGKFQGLEVSILGKIFPGRLSARRGHGLRGLREQLTETMVEQLGPGAGTSEGG